MQPKVSVVMPIYNKINYIGHTLRSVYEQTWENIELIFVNDGATDGTREVLETWLPKFKKRGCEVIVIDQENAGINAAVLAGLKRISGEYVCCIDCDDEILPDYIACMAGALTAHPEYDWAGCHFEGIVDTVEGRRIIPVADLKYGMTPRQIFIGFLFARITRASWCYLVRRTYFEKCGIVKNFVLTPPLCQEPSLVIPLAAHGGKIYHIQKVLYCHNENGSADMKKSHQERALRNPNFNYNYMMAYRKAVQRLIIGEPQKQQMLLIEQLAEIKARLFLGANKNGQEETPQNIAEQAVVLVNRLLCLTPSVTVADIEQNGFDKFFVALENRLLEKPFCPVPSPLPGGRIIGYGAVDPANYRALIQLEKSPLKPTVLWEEKEVKDSLHHGIPVEKPNFPSLTSKDIVLIFPMDTAVEKQIVAEIRKYVPSPAVGTIEKLRNYRANLMFPSFWQTHLNP